MKKLLLSIVSCVALLSCKKNETQIVLPATEKNVFNMKDNQIKIAVVSDIHYTAPALFSNNGQAGQAFQDYLAQDPKLLAYSDPIWRRVLADLRADKPDILLVPGDLTKDGERISHEAMAGFFQSLQSDGVKVYVVPGNHDVSNPEARRYNGDNALPTPNVSPADFSNLYAPFGYAAAISRDPNSLSYVAQPYPGLWIMGIDACRYEDNTDKSTTPGRIKSQTLSWMLERLAEAKAQNITVFGMMHHNLLEHYTNQSILDPGYVIDNWQSISEKLMDAGLRIIFTGHYHATDITRVEKEKNELFDIETGSLVTAPIPYRRIVMKNKDLDITTTQVTSINASFPDGMSFTQYANSFLSAHLDVYFNYLLTTPAFGAPPTLAAFAAPIFRQGIMAHLAGDEKINPQQKNEVAQLAGYSPELAQIVGFLWNDLPVKDNKENVKYRD
ncbi:metallophosphoesterase family protein [Flavisolibacter ginsenosidimutans]|uniref:Metallophosphoesterase n=1 Tax=Flavisolibacter ginsenosidimutans TaxID=661481 RepID=A0A5B8UKY0_9BACT|nr:metallophosphoesterase [Flavisolibacter ginsenosidimutans]QEC57351.1 metallophosphoesterase [Flavisolibacter ginsenosidimutans]